MERPPAFSYASYTAPEPYQPFVGPTLEQAQSEPGYAFARDEGQRALENSASAKGIVRTGGTLKDFIGWGNRFAEQNFGNVYNRTANTYATNRDTWAGNERARATVYDRNRNNAADAYKTNWGIDTDVYDRNTGTALDVFDREYRQSLAEFDDIYRRDRDEMDALTRIATAGAGA